MILRGSEHGWRNSNASATKPLVEETTSLPDLTVNGLIGAPRQLTNQGEGSSVDPGRVDRQIRKPSNARRLAVVSVRLKSGHLPIRLYRPFRFLAFRAALRASSAARFFVSRARSLVAFALAAVSSAARLARRAVSRAACSAASSAAFSTASACLPPGWLYAWQGGSRER